MKFIELVKDQSLTIQLLWGEQKIEFLSKVIDKDNSVVYVTPYLHNGSELELNVVQGKDIICNIFTNEPSTKHRISWKNIELTTVIHDDKTVYCLKTNGYNHVANHDDRRMHNRLIVQVKAKVYDEQSSEGVDIIVHDISNVGISFYAPQTFSPKTNHLNIEFSDYINEKIFNINVECIIARTTNKAGNIFCGCRILKENRDYQLYGFMKRLNAKNRSRMIKPEEEDLSENKRNEMSEEGDLSANKQNEISEELSPEKQTDEVAEEGDT